MKKLIIDRSLWRTGSDSDKKTGKGSTSLLNSQGFMCCLGFEALRLKYERSDIVDIGEPCDITGVEDFHNTEFVAAAIRINDGSLPLKKKEAELIPLFKEVGVELEFINQPTYE